MLSIHLTVAAVILQNHHYLLVEERDDHRTVYNQPAGHVELNETPVQAIIRETLEETAWYFQPTAIIGIYFYTSPHNQITYQRICFTGHLIHHEPQRGLDPDIIRTVWFDYEQIMAKANYLRSPIVLRCIADYQQKIRYPLNLITSFDPPT